MNTELICLFCVIITAIADQEINPKRYDEQTNMQNLPRRLLDVMRAYYENSFNRVKGLNKQRWMYEESREYQVGYLMHETITRYKKIIGSMQSRSNHTYSNLHRVATIQENYFEIYHLVNMIHEIPLKVRVPKRERQGSAANQAQILLNLMKAEEAMYRDEEKKRKQRIKSMQSWENLKKKYGISGDPSQTFDPPIRGKPNPYNKYWPLDYGWEIENFELWPVTG